MPAEIPTSRLAAFLKALRDTGNATLAAEWAGVSRDWAYKRRRQDPWFDALYRQMKAMAARSLREAASRDARAKRRKCASGVTRSESA